MINRNVIRDRREELGNLHYKQLHYHGSFIVLIESGLRLVVNGYCKL